MNKVRYETKSYYFTFEEDEDSYLYAYRQGSESNTCIKIKIYDKSSNRQVSSYYRKFNKKADENHITNFVNKFMIDSKYRKDFHIEGEHIVETIEEKPVDIRCIEQINKLNEIPETNLKFADYAQLKTYGRDEVSSKSLEELLENISEDIFIEIVGSFSDISDQMRALRWIKRGLQPEKAIKKIEVDLQVKAKCLE